ncbi:MAG: hypothetical protein OXC48_06400 [Endozoicomonadaceae bacterium]|nr:hypothetical protein [Endozoicomonadaceae bacterium]
MTKRQPSVGVVWTSFSPTGLPVSLGERHSRGGGNPLAAITTENITSLLRDLGNPCRNDKVISAPAV